MLIHRLSSFLVLLASFILTVIGNADNLRTSTLERYIIHPWNSSTGGPTDRINNIVEGSDGFLWLATFEGLIRFDGSSYKVFNHQNHPELVGGISNLMETQPGIFWMVSAGGGLFRMKEGKFTLWTIEDGFYPAFTEHLVKGPNAKPVFFDGRRYLTINQQDQIVPLPLPGLPFIDPFRFSFGADGTFWVVPRSGGLLSYKDGVIRVFNLTTMGAREERPSNIVTQPDGSLWLSFDDQIALLRPNETKFEFFPILPHSTQSRPFLITQSRDGVSLGGNAMGNLYFVSPSGVEKLPLTDIGNPATIIYGITSLRDGGYALATHSEGLVFLFPTTIDYFTKNHGLRSELINAIVPINEDQVLIAHNEGIDVFSNGLITPFLMNGAPFTDYTIDILKDSRSRLWLATAGNGLFLFQAGEWMKFGRENGLVTDVIRVLAEDSKGNIWIGTREGLYRWNNGLRKFFGLGNGLRSAYILSLHVDQDDRVWVGTARGGLHLIEDDELVDFHTEETRPFATRTIFGMATDRDGTVWGGMSGGVFRIQDGVVEFLNLFQFMDVDSVFHILDDGSNYFWLASSNGLHRVPEHKFRQEFNSMSDLTPFVRSFNRSDGLPTEVMRANSRVWIDDNQHLWVPSNRGFFIIDPRILPAEPTIRNVYFDQILVNDALITGEWFQRRLHFDLDPKVNRIRFEFVAPAFRPSNSVLSEVRLVPLESEWRLTGERFIEYTNLSPGAYTLEVRVFAGSNLNATSSATAVATFTVAAALHETIWLYIIIGLILLALGAALSIGRVSFLNRQREELEFKVSERSKEIKLREEKLAEQNQLLLRLNEEKNQFMGVAAHDLRSPLATIEGLANLIEEEAKLLESAQVLELSTDIQTCTERMRILLENLLDVNRIERGELRFDKKTLDLSPVSAKVVQRYQRIAAEKSIALKHIPPAGSLKVFSDESLVIQILENFISNALKFSLPGTEVTVILVSNDGKIQLLVKDQGPGIPEGERDQLFQKFSRISNRPTGSENSTGLGLSISRQLAILLGHRVGFEPNVPHGSIFWIEFIQL
jgi:signal transduction histidine kinase/ligand-binding sensor domain-containing protein